MNDLAVFQASDEPVGKSEHLRQDIRINSKEQGKRPTRREQPQRSVSKEVYNFDLWA